MSDIPYEMEASGSGLPPPPTYEEARNYESIPLMNTSQIEPRQESSLHTSPSHNIDTNVSTCTCSPPYAHTEHIHTCYRCGAMQPRCHMCQPLRPGEVVLHPQNSQTTNNYSHQSVPITINANIIQPNPQVMPAQPSYLTVHPNIVGPQSQNITGQSFPQTIHANSWGQDTVQNEPVQPAPQIQQEGETISSSSTGKGSRKYVHIFCFSFFFIIAVTILIVIFSST